MMAFSRRIQRGFWCLATMGSLVVLLSATACSRRPETAERLPTATADAAGEDPQSEQLLRSIVGLLTGRGDSQAFEAAISQLNQYQARNPAAIPSLTSEERQRLTTLFGPQAAGIAASPEFRSEDVETLRTASLARKIVRNLEPGAKTRLDLARQIFEWTVRHVVLVALGEEVRLTPADTALRGLGDVRDRMWVFFELLRQADMEGIVVAVTTNSMPDQVTPWLCAVVLDGEAYLFDPVAGIPVRGPSSEPSSIATLRDLVANPGLAAAIYSGTPGSLVAADDIRDFRLMIPFDGTVLSPRAAYLQSLLTGDARLNLTLDYAAAEARAVATLPEENASLGAQPWRYPLETISAQPSLSQWDKTAHWLLRDGEPRRLQIEGQTKDAIRMLVDRDFHSESALFNELVTKELPIKLRRTLLGRRGAGVVYFAGVAQWDANPNEPSVAEEWFSRYIADYGDWRLKARDLLEINVLAGQLQGGLPSEAPSLAKMVFASLSPSVQALVDKAAKVKERARFVESPTKEAPIQLNVPPTLSPNGINDLLDDINRVLADGNLFPHAEISGQLDVAPATPLARLLGREAKSLSPEALAWRNRLVFDQVFRDSIVPADRPWLVGAVRSAAMCKVQMEEREEAIALLRGEYPTLSPIQSTSLVALANALDEPKDSAAP